MLSRDLSGKHELCQRNCTERVQLFEFVKREFIGQYFGAKRRKTEKFSMLTLSTLCVCEVTVRSTIRGDAFLVNVAIHVNELKFELNLKHCSKAEVSSPK